MTAERIEEALCDAPAELAAASPDAGRGAELEAAPDAGRGTDPEAGTSVTAVARPSGRP